MPRTHRLLDRSRSEIRRAAIITGAVVLVASLATQAGALEDGPVTCGGVESLGRINNAPLAVDDDAWTAPGGPVIVEVLANDQDFDGDDLVIVDVFSPGHGVATIAGTAVVYEPGLGYEGTDTFRYVVSDLRCGTHEASVRVQVSPNPPPPDRAVPDPPVVAPIKLTG